MSRSFQRMRPNTRSCVTFRNNQVFYGEEFFAPRPTPKLKDHSLTDVSGCLFNILAALGRLLHPQPEDASCRGDRDHCNMDLYASPNFIRVIKSRRMRWPVHVARTEEMRNAYNILVRKPEGKTTRKTKAYMEG